MSRRDQALQLIDQVEPRAPRLTPQLQLAHGAVHGDGWTDVEIQRFLKREALFGRRGHTATEAEALAAVAQRRDRERDERRMCVECKHLQQDGGCFAARQGWLLATPANFTPVRTLLQRCDQFDWAKA